MKKIKITYWISTGLLTAMMLMSAGMYFFNYEMISETFTNLGYPAYVIYPLGIAKILGLVAIWSGISKSLKEWAYAGFFFDFVLAFFAHLMIGDGEFGGAVIATILLFVSYFSWKKL
jgi:hypothetical protein